MATPKLMPERLRLAAARCIVNSTPNWWDAEMTDTDEFYAVNQFEPASNTPCPITTAEDAATLLLLVAEALDE